MNKPSLLALGCMLISSAFVGTQVFASYTCQETVAFCQEKHAEVTKMTAHTAHNTHVCRQCVGDCRYASQICALNNNKGSAEQAHSLYLNCKENPYCQ